MCNCNHIMNSIGRPPDFLTILPPPPSLPNEFLLNLVDNLINSNLKCLNNNYTTIATKQQTNNNIIFSSHNTSSSSSSSFILITIIVFIALIIALVLFILFAFIYVYLNRIKLLKKNQKKHENNNVSISVMPFHQINTQNNLSSESSTSPSSTQSHLTSINSNEFSTNKYNVKSGQIIKNNSSIDSTSSSYCSQFGLVNNKITARNNLFNLSTSSNNSTSGVLMSSNSFLKHNTTNYKNLTSDGFNFELNNNTNCLMFPPVRQLQKGNLQKPNENHQYESISDLSQFYFDINDELRNNFNLMYSPTQFSYNTTNQNLLTLSNSNRIQQNNKEIFVHSLIV